MFLIFIRILTLLPRVDAIILELRFGVYDKIYSTEEIAKLFNRTELEIIRILKSALEKVQMLSNSISKEIIKIMEDEVVLDTDLQRVRKDVEA